MSRLILARVGARLGAATLALFAVFLLVSAGAASAGPGYQLASTASLSDEVPVGVAVDQSSGAVYVAELSKKLLSFQPGEVEQLEPNGQPTVHSPFSTGGDDLFISVAVNPTNHGIYAYQGETQSPVGQKGKSQVSTFSSTGALGGSFAVTNSLTGTIAADSSGRLVMPNSVAGNVQVFSSTGTLEGTIACGACPGGDFSEPGAAAFDSAGNLYVVDRAGEGRVVELSPSGGGYAYARTIQSGRGATAVAVDVSDDDVFVGDFVGNKYHVVVYDSAGNAFDDFAAGLSNPPSFVHIAVGQLAVNSTTHDLYLTDPAGDRLRVFERVASIPAPTATAAAPSSVGQVTATLNASVNPKGHVLTTCEFQYTDHADFLANGYANAEVGECPPLVGDPGSVSIGSSLTGLEPETTYDYRVRIASFGGTAESGDEEFQTLPPLPPEASTGAATSLTKTTATLGGTVNAKGGTISSCGFEYVTETGFQANGFTGAAFKACASAPSGNASTAVSAKVTGLVAGTTYRFRVVATNNSGTTEAAPGSFATVAETCAENAALCPPPPVQQETPASTPPPPASTGPVVPSTPKRPLKCRKGFKKRTVHGKQKCVKAKKRHRSR